MNAVFAIINVVNHCQCVILTQSEDQDRLLLGFNLLELYQLGGRRAGGPVAWDY